MTIAAGEVGPGGLVPNVDERKRVLGLLRRHGFNTTSFQALEDGLSYWWDSEDACVAYADTTTAWVAAGAPISSAEACGAVAMRFMAAAREAGRRAIFFASQQRLAGVPGQVSVQVGLQPIWDPRTWQARAQQSKSLRYQLKRARGKGVSVRRVAASELSDPGSPARIGIERTIRRWLGTRRMSAMAFLVHVQPFSFAEERRAFVAERDGEVVGFVSAVPVYTRTGWFIEDLIRDPSAPNGTMEALVDAVMQQAASEGSTWVTLGLVPLAGEVPGWMRRLGVLGRPLYDFAGLHAFKSKLAPVAWEPVFLTHGPGVPTSVAVLDALRAFAGGGLSSFVIRTLLEGPALVLWTLAILLIPWTIALGLVDAARWFPSIAIRNAWIGFDLLVIAAMILLARRFERRLATVTAIAVSLDGLLSMLQAAVWNAPRVRGVLDAVVVVSACAAPIFAAAVLWRGGYRDRARRT
ncbi:MAG TPA: DUF2156 domain-containing protein [Planctomycetota bacterium]|nr:DUF2156 domain-containing protein [Planctomycetota bacterium]